MRLLLKSYAITLCLLFSAHTLALDISQKVNVNFVTEANYYPFEYLDQQRKIQGFDIDIAKALCKVANLNCKFHNQSFDSLLLTLQFGRFDAVIAALDITEARQSKVDFSNSYYQSPPVFVSQISNDGKFSIDGKFIGVQSDSSNHQYLIENAKTSSFIISYLSSSEAFSDLSNAKIDVVFADQAVANDFLSQGENELKFSVMKTEDVFLKSFSTGYGIAVKKGNKQLLERINFGLQKIQEDGTYQQIYNHYFPPLVIVD